MKKNPIYLILKTARPRQWIKNLALYAALIFSGFLFYSPMEGHSYFLIVTQAFIAFCFVASGVYIVNDIVDAPADRQHPFKKKRPIASGDLSPTLAGGAALLFFFAAAVISLPLGWLFKLLLLCYVLLQFLYAKKLKHIPVIDVVTIATGFLIRIYAGAAVVNLHTNVWFLLTVISTSLFLAVAKRQSERTLLEGLTQSIGDSRKILKRYSDRLLDQYIGMFANASWLTFAIFTFQSTADDVDTASIESMYRNSPQWLKIIVDRLPEFYEVLPNTLQSQKLLMLSIPFVIFGVMRYLQLIYEQNQGESPERVLLSDKPILVTASLFVSVVFVVIYVLPLI